MHLLLLSILLLSSFTFTINIITHNNNNNDRPSHPIRRLMLPFTFGAIYSNRIYSEYLRKHGLFHRCFAFKYNALKKLMNDSVNGTYAFKLFKKKVSYMRSLPDSVFPLSTDCNEFWLISLNLVSRSFPLIYGVFDEPSKEERERAIADNNEQNLPVDKLLIADKDLHAFYEILIKKLNIEQRFRLKRFNVIHLLTHFICISSLWNKHLSSAVSFEYSTDVNFSGLKIRGNNSYENDVQSYVQLCSVVLSKGICYASLMKDGWKNIVYSKNIKWKISGNDVVNNNKLVQVYEAYLNELNAMQNHVNHNNRNRRIPLFSGHPKYLQCSIAMI